MSGKERGIHREREGFLGKRVLKNSDTRDSETIVELQNSRIPVNLAVILIIAKFCKISAVSRRDSSTPWGCENGAIGRKSVQNTS